MSNRIGRQALELLLQLGEQRSGRRPRTDCCHAGLSRIRGQSQVRKKALRWWQRCPWHGLRFDRCSGEVSRGPSAAPLPRYQTRIIDGIIELRGDVRHSLAAGNAWDENGGAK
jgi:hypothetical protein